MSLTLIVIIVLVLCAVGWGGYGYPRYRGPAAPDGGPYWIGGFAPLGFILVALIVLYLFGGLRIR